MIPQIQLADGYQIPRLLVGAWQLSAGHSDAVPDQAAMFATWDRCLDLGLSTFDGADIYSGVEALIGAYRRRRIAAGTAPPQVHTKFVPDLEALATIDRRYVAAVVDRSLRRLGAERLDLIQFHWWDYSVPRYRETLGYLDDLRRDGKIARIGLTNFDTRHLKELLATGIPIASLQLQYSVLDQRPARGLAAAAQGAEVALLCYGALAGGFLSDRWLGRPAPTSLENRSLVKYRLIIDEVGGWPRFQTILTALRSVANDAGVTIAAVALRFVLDQPAVAAAIVGVRSPDHLDDLEAACRLRLTPAAHAAIAAATGPNPGPAGDVYAAEREPGGRHAAIMKYDLNARATD